MKLSPIFDSSLGLLFLVLLLDSSHGFQSIQRQQQRHPIRKRNHHYGQQQHRKLAWPLMMSSTNETREQTIIRTSAETTIKKKPGSAVMETPWEELGFEFRPTNSHVKLVYKEDPLTGVASWGDPELVSTPFVNIHIGATALHYGQSCFEGLKAFCHADDNVYLFRPQENAARMQSSCRRLLMAELPTETFIKAVKMVVKDNIEYVPPYGSNGALYIRPLLFGSGPRIGLQPASEYTFLCMAIPVGDYYKGGLSKPVNGKIMEQYDRAAPQGVGNVKVAGNYAADLLPNMMSKKEGYPIILYLDSATKSTIDEFSTSNFVGIDNKNNKFVTPNTATVLPSVTNKSLMHVAANDFNMTVEARSVSVDEMNTFDEVMAVGTAVVVTPVGSITRYTTTTTHNSDDDSTTTTETKKVVYKFGKEGEIGSTTKSLYDRIRAIQNGHVEDKYGWLVKVE